MEKTIIKEISKKGLDTYFTAREYEALYWATFFPLKSVISLDFTTLIGEQGGRVAADVIAYDAEAPLKTRRALSKMRGDIPKIAVKRRMTEKDLLEYNILSAMSNSDEKQILDLVYNDLDFVVDSANARMEWLALQAISQTKIALSKTNNDGLVTEESVDYLMPSDNKFGATVVWAGNPTTAKPITDFKKVAKQARKSGHQILFALMHPDAFDDFIAADETANFLKSYFKLVDADVNVLEDLESVNKVLSRNKLPQIVVIDQSVDIEIESTRTSVNPFNSAYVTFIPSTNLGNMLNGPIAEELYPPKQAIQSKAGNVLVSKYSTIDPVNEYTKGECNAFPSWKNIDRCYSLKVDATSWS